ncbi:LPS export ABC transporter periplasmic protein LptC [Oleispirillum naphthae]|uniref:LPS export ABC transporter periplasmic protein LptC n=1 Tax=Oleispirillum naphthae TaxID=2838853 RepID=UPI0030825863
MTRRQAARKPAAAPAPPGAGAPPDLRFLSAGAAANRSLPNGASFYSRFVRVMKLALPAVAALLLGAILLWPQFQAERNRFHVALSGLDPRHPDRLRVVNARFQGTDSDSQPYTVTSESAHEVAPGSRVIALEAPTADLALKDGTWVIARAPEGKFDRDRDLLDLSGGVSVFHDSGYAFSSPTARILLHEGAAEGDDPATAFGPAADIKSDTGFRITDRGRRILFKGKSRLILRPGVKNDAPIQ